MLTTMIKNNYYEITDTHFREYPIRFIEQEEYFYKVFFPAENIERKLNDNIKYRELTLTNIHLERMGFIDENNKFVPVKNHYIFPQHAIGGDSNYNLSFLFFGYTIIKVEDAEQYWLKYRKFAKDYLDQKISKYDINNEFASFYTVNNLFDRLEEVGILVENKDFIITGNLING